MRTVASTKGGEATNDQNTARHSQRRGRRRSRGAVCTGALAVQASAKRNFRAATVRIVVPFPAGATTDLLARLIANRLSETMGQSFVVENVGGGGGSIGADQVAKAAPDGHTLLFHNITFSTTTSSLLFAKRARHDFDDFVPVSVGAYVPLLLLANNVGAGERPQGIRRLRQDHDHAAVLRLDRTRQHPASDGRGAQTRRRHQDGSRAVPRRGAAGHRPDRGPRPVRRRPAVSSLERVRSGQIKALAVATKSVALPNVPTVRELGYPEPRTARLERLPRAQGHARAGDRASAAGNRRGGEDTPTCKSA